MQIIEYLNKQLKTHPLEQVLSMLYEQYGITGKAYQPVKLDERKLILLNYDLLENGTEGCKFHPMTVECRSLVLLLENNYCKAVSYAFSRFFNYAPIADVKAMEHSFLMKGIDISPYYLRMSATGEFQTETLALNKEDGSLIVLYFEPISQQWFFRTRKMLFCEEVKTEFKTIDGQCISYDTGKTWLEFILETVGCESLEDLQSKMSHVSKTQSFIFEWIGKYNIQIVPQVGNKLVLLGVSDLNSMIVNVDSTTERLEIESRRLATLSNIEPVLSFKVTTIQEAQRYLESQANLIEGLVLHQPEFGIRLKLKTQSYLDAFHLKSEGFTTDRILESVANFTESKVTKCFSHLEGLAEALEELAIKRDIAIMSAQVLLDENNHLTIQKEFAEIAKTHLLCDLIFSARRMRLSVLEVWKTTKTSAKVRLMNKLNK